MTTKKDVHYLIHDYNAYEDSKLSMVRMKHGWAGYGVYWRILEHLRQQAGNMIKHDEIEAFVFTSQTPLDIVQDVINNYKLFIVDNDYIYSERLCRDTEHFKSMRQKKIEAGRSGGLAKAKQRSSTATSTALAEGKQNVAIREEKKREEKRTNVQPAVDVSNLFSEDSNEMDLAKGMYKSIKSDKGNAHVKEPRDYQKWAQVFDLILRVDKKTYDEICDLLTWTGKDDFWKGTCHSPTNFRKNYGQLYAKRAREDKPSKGGDYWNQMIPAVPTGVKVPTMAENEMHDV